MGNVAYYTPDNEDYHHGRKISEDNILQVINHDANKLQGEFDIDLEKIIYQKYLSSFMNREWDSYYDYRRTGYPVFPINPSTNQNIDNTKIDRKSTRLNSSHVAISYAVFCLKKKT